MPHFLASEPDFFIANYFFIYRISICAIVLAIMESETERVERIHTSSSSSPKKIFSNDSSDHANIQLDQLNDAGSTLHINGCEGDLSNKNNVSEQLTNVDINCERSEDFAVKDEMLSEVHSGQNVAEEESLSSEQHMQASKENIL